MGKVVSGRLLRLGNITMPMALTLKRYFFTNIQLFDEIKTVIIKTCISSEPVMLDIHSKTQDKKNCGFQLYGFDILIDNTLKPWLM